MKDDFPSCSSHAASVTHFLGLVTVVRLKEEGLVHLQHDFMSAHPFLKEKRRPGMSFQKGKRVPQKREEAGGKGTWG